MKKKKRFCQIAVFIALIFLVTIGGGGCNPEKVIDTIPDKGGIMSETNSIVDKINVEMIQSAVDDYYHHEGKYPEGDFMQTLANKGYFSPTEHPFGGEYILDKSNGRVSSSHQDQWVE